MLWFLQDSNELSKKSRKLLIDSKNELFWSSASFWEITVKVSLRKLELEKDWQEQLEREKKTNRIQNLPIYQRHCEHHLNLPWHHRDPFDRLLICQAISEDLILITRDKNIQKYKLRTVW
jgi:PIN domain nuclease of toxin-antitoxin system